MKYLSLCLSEEICVLVLMRDCNFGEGNRIRPNILYNKRMLNLSPKYHHTDEKKQPKNKENIVGIGI